MRGPVGSRLDQNQAPGYCRRATDLFLSEKLIVEKQVDDGIEMSAPPCAVVFSV